MASSTALDIYLKSGDSKGWLNRSLLLNEWKQLISVSNIHIIQIIVSVNIFKIKLKKYAINHGLNGILSHYRFNQSQTFSDYRKKQTFEYTIDHYTLQKFKASYYGKRYESVIFNNQWRIRWFPNGANHDCASFMSIYLVLCRIPFEVSKITTKYRISCLELNKSISAVDDFSFSASNWGKSKFCSLAEMSQLHSLTFTVELEVLHEIKTHKTDESEYELWDEAQINYVLSLDNTAHSNDKNGRNSQSNSHKSFEDIKYEMDDEQSQSHSQSQSFKKELKALKKRISSKDKSIDSLTQKVSNLKLGLKEEVSKRNKVVKQLNHKINALSEYIYNNNSSFEEKHNQNKSANTEVLHRDVSMLKKKLKELQLSIDGNIAKKLDESSKKQQLKLWLTNKCELPQYFDNLVLNGFDDFESLRDLSKEVMTDIGIDKIGHQLKLMRMIRKLSIGNGGDLNIEAIHNHKHNNHKHNNMNGNGDGMMYDGMGNIEDDVIVTSGGANGKYNEGSEKW